MNAHFTSFTPEAMRAFGQELADGCQRRTEFINHARNDTLAMLADFRNDRRQRAERETNARRLFTSELTSAVHSLLGRFELSRKEMASEIHAACDAFRHRPGRQNGANARSSAEGQPRSSAEGQPRRSKKRHG